MKLSVRAARRRPSRKAAVTLAAGLALVLSPLLVPIAVGATAAPTAAPATDPECLSAREAERSAAELFALGCEQLSEDYGEMDDSSAENTPQDRIASKNMSLLANRPKTGAFVGSVGLDQANSDLAFKGNLAFAGNFSGFMVYNVKNPTNPKPLTQVVCPGGQGDISVFGNLLVFSVDSPRTTDQCDSQASNANNPTAWEGLRIYNIKNPRQPRYVKSVKTACGSHTHSLAPSPDGRTLFAYVSSYFPSDTNVNCPTPHDKISVVKIPVGKAFQSKVATTPVLFPDGGNPGGNGSNETSGCHDITTYVKKNIAAGACMGDGVLMDIKNRYQPRITERVRDTENFAFWHSATWNNAGTKVVFTDELGGGVAATCNPEIGSTRGANGIYNVNRNGDLVFQSYYKIKRTQTNEENCVAHNGSLIPVEGRDIMVQAWYQGGISVFDFSDSKNPRELAWFDRGPVDPPGTPPFPVGTIGGSWSAYWHNGKVFSNDIQKGFDVLDVDVPAVRAAKRVREGTNNPQAQKQY